jgi:CheY-specific phosphatase CheX
MTLAESLVEAMETMAFISPQLPDPATPPAASPDMRLVRINFHGGGVSGSLAISAPAKFGEIVAENCGADDPHGAADDAMKELANVTCGLLLRKRLGHGVGFKMAPPIVGRLEDRAKFIAGDDVVAMNADGHLVTAHVTTDEAILAGAGTR